ncbi:MAG: hypothetical protein ACE5JL_00190 [Dehalococcoidia bacterium]
MDPKTLVYLLLEAEDESGVDAVLSDAGYLTDDESIWIPLGGYENNFSTVGNQQSDPTGALVDKIINGIDAVLMAECFAQGLSPESPHAPQTMAAAVEQFFGVRGGRLDSISARERTSLAEGLQLRVIAVGSKDDPCYLLAENGEGQTPAMFPDTFLSLNRSNKLRIPFVQGKFNAGGTGVLPFCGTKNYQLIVSRRHPAAPRASDDTTAPLWGFTIVRRLPPSKGRRSSMYVYLAPDGRVLTFDAPGINVLPGDDAPNRPPKPYQRPLEYGTCVKLYNYRWRAKSTATTEARYELERYLHAPCLPFRVTETRDYRANYYSTTISGVWATVASDDGAETKAEPGFPATAQMNITGVGSLPYRMVVFGEDVASRHVPNGVFFTVNGQVHGRLLQEFIKSHLKFDYLSRHLLVSVDCTNMEGRTREDFFMASRDRIRQNEAYEEVMQQLEEELRSHPGLRALNAARRQKEIEKAIDSERSSVETFRHLLRSDPALAGLFSTGVQLVTSTGPGEPPKFKGKRFPTYFQLSKEPKEGLVKHCPINRSIRVDFETDAVNDYFTRTDSPGTITFDLPDVCQHWHLWNGRLSATFRPPQGASVGDRVRVRVTVSDVENEMRGGPFVCRFRMDIDKSLERKSGPGDKTKDKDGPNGDKDKAPRLAVPNIREVSKDKWNSMEPPFTALDALRVRQDGEGGYDFYLNIDNSFLLTELSRRGDVEKALIKYWFKYGLALCALGMLQQYRAAGEQSHNGHTQGEGAVLEGGSEVTDDPVDLVNQAMRGLARVIIPVVLRLYRGPD